MQSSVRVTDEHSDNLEETPWWEMTAEDSIRALGFRVESENVQKYNHVDKSFKKGKYWLRVKYSDRGSKDFGFKLRAHFTIKRGGTNYYSPIGLKRYGVKNGLIGDALKSAQIK